MDQTPAPTQDVPSRTSLRITGAAVALALGGVVVAVLGLFRPFGGGEAALFERPDLIVTGLAIVAVLGWRLGNEAGRSGWRRALGGGLAFGLLLPPLTITVALIAEITDATLRGAASGPNEIGTAFTWFLYAVVLAWIYGSILTVPAGIIWGLVTRSLAGIRIASRFRPSRRPTVRLLVAVLVISLSAGAAQAVAYTPRDERCLDLSRGTPTDAAFSPNGDLLAVTLETDPNQPGTVVLMHWPSGQVIASWSAWVADSVAVDPAGRVYWSAWVLGVSTDDNGDGIYSAVAGSSPKLFATGDERELDDLTWTANGLTGTTPNSHEIAVIPLIGDGTQMDFMPSSDEVGAFWSAADGSATVAGPGYGGTSLAVTIKDGGTQLVAVNGDPRSVALSADGRTIVEAGWFDGTRLIDVATGETHLVMRGSQVFVALSERGDLAWANDEQFGTARLCTSTLARLGAG